MKRMNRFLTPGIAIAHIAANMWEMTMDHLLTPTAADSAPSRTT